MYLSHAKWSFLCSLDTLLQKNVIVFSFGNQISKMALIWKKGYFWPTFHQGKVSKIPSARISLTYIHVFCSPYQLYFALPIVKKYEFFRYGYVWFLVLVLICTILEQSINNKMVGKTLVGMSTTDMYLYTNAKFIVICKPQTLNGGGEDSVQYTNRKKHCFLAAAILLFIGKIIITW